VINLKVKCPDCKYKFDIDNNEYDDGDYLSCPDCNLELAIELDDFGKLKVKTSKEKELDELEEFDEYFED
jgi:hypothetical protein